jgi:hypothetical protein
MLESMKPPKAPPPSSLKRAIAAAIRKRAAAAKPTAPPTDPTQPQPWKKPKTKNTTPVHRRGGGQFKPAPSADQYGSEPGDSADLTVDQGPQSPGEGIIDEQ